MKELGILAAVFSLPGRYGIGDLGKCAYDFIDLLAEKGVQIWQVLPLNPVGFGSSPYQPYSSYAGDTVYIDLDDLYERGLLHKKPEAFKAESVRADYELVRGYKQLFFAEAFGNFLQGNDPRLQAAYEEFASQPWVYVYGAFKALKNKNAGRGWTWWNEEDKQWIRLYREDREAALQKIAPLDWPIRMEMFLQFLFAEQWRKLKAYANGKGIRMMGDIPFYVGLDSADVWEHQECFLLDSDGFPTSVAGVPPDYFSKTGQRWGNPIYNWEQIENDGFSFWNERIKAAAKLFDLVRIDHFRAFDTYWKVPASCETAMEGEWIKAPGYKLFDQLLPQIPDVQIVAEDLGEMFPEVYALRDHYHFPGMNVLQFTLTDPGFDLRDNLITYTGTHDNDTAKHWYESLSEAEQKETYAVLTGLLSAKEVRKLRDGTLGEASGRGKKLLFLQPKKRKALEEERLKRQAYEALTEEEVKNADAAALMVSCALRTKTDYVILSVQDILGLGEEGRINTPGEISESNWTWKLSSLPDLKAL